MAEHTRRFALHECSEVILVQLQDLSAEADGATLLFLVWQTFGQVEQAHVNCVRVDLNRDAALASTGSECRWIESEPPIRKGATEVDPCCSPLTHSAMRRMRGCVVASELARDFFLDPAIRRIEQWGIDRDDHSPLNCCDFVS